jgi:putative OPT family oligopeptide transporter
VLGVASVVCISSAVAGEMLQDLKVGHILGGTPWKMQVGDFIGVWVSSLVMFFPIFLLYVTNVGSGGSGFGDPKLAAPQAGLMAMLSKGIVGGEMAWPLVIVGAVLGIAMILIKVRSPMLFSVGMYLPLETTFAIFVGGIIRGITDMVAKRRNYNDAQRIRVDNAGVLGAAGLIAGEALMGLLIAAVFYFFFLKQGKDEFWQQSFYTPHGFIAILFAIFLALYLIVRPLKNAGKADEPPPPSAMM